MLGGAGVTSSADLGPAPTRLRPGRIATRSSLEPVLGVEIGSPPHREIVRGSRAPSVGPTAPEGPVGTRRAGRDAEPPDTREARLLGLVAGPASNGAVRYEKGPPEPGRSVLTQRGARRICEGPAPNPTARGAEAEPRGRGRIEMLPLLGPSGAPPGDALAAPSRGGLILGPGGHHHDRAGRVRQDALAHRAQQQPREPAPAA